MGSGILDFRSADSQTVSVLLDTHDEDLKKSGTCGLTNHNSACFYFFGEIQCA